MKTRAAVLVGMILVSALSRVIPHPPNFTPVGAVALFGAAHLRSKWAAFLLPLAALFLSDLALEATTALGWYGGWMAHGTGFYQGMWVVYGTVVLVTALGLLLRRRKSLPRVAGSVLACSTLFFLVTNFAWWAGYSLYPHTLEGLVLSYTAAIPFFHWTLLGDAFYATVLFGGFALAERHWPALQPHRLLLGLKLVSQASWETTSLPARAATGSGSSRSAPTGDLSST